MKVFATELQGRTVMSTDGKIIGQLDNFVVDTKDGEVHHVLVIPHEDIDPEKFRMDSQGRLVIPFKKLKSAKDVVVMGPL
jgi:sporulation protein YlmC with PRC-barrel domain